MTVRKILFINPPYVKYGGVEGQGGKNTPLNLAYLAAYVRQQRERLEVAVVDAEARELSFEQILEEVDSFSPDVVGITCPTPVYYNVREICRLIREKDDRVRIVLGGPHPTALPAETLAEVECDAAVIGEGELTFLDLVDAFDGDRPLSEVPGIAFRDGAEPRVNPPRELIGDLDVLPFPAKDLLPLDLYYLPPTKRIRSERATNMVTSRGCPFDCNFCMARTTWTRKTRLRSVANVLDEIGENVERFGLTEFSFHDEFFTFRKRRVMEFCQGLHDRGHDITWVCQARAGSVDREMLDAMREAGCGKIAFGFESGSMRMLKLMNKKETLENALESSRLCREAGVAVEGAFILGYPGEDMESIKATIDFSLRLECETAAFFIAIPFPGTRLWEEALKEGYLKEPVDWAEFAPVSNRESPMIIPNFTPDELQAWKKKAYRSYYLRPRYVLRRLAGIKSVADARDILRGLKIFRNVTSSF